MFMDRRRQEPAYSFGCVVDMVAAAVVVVVDTVVVAVALGRETEAWWDHCDHERACVVLSNACFQFESHSFVQWQLRQT